MTSDRLSGGRTAIEARTVPYPAEFRDRYRMAGAWGTQTIPDMLRATAAAHRAKPAVITAHATMTFGELDALSDRLGAALLQVGFHDADRVLMQVGNCAESVVLWYATLKAGLIPVATLPQHRAHEIDAICTMTEAAGHAVQTDLSPDLTDFAVSTASRHRWLKHTIVLRGEVPRGMLSYTGLLAAAPDATAAYEKLAADVHVDADDIAVFQLSGGTTALPKVIPRRHAEYVYNAVLHARSFGYDAHTRPLHITPLIHNAGIACALHPAHFSGCPVILASPEMTELSAIIRKFRPTHMLATPGIAASLAAQPEPDAFRLAEPARFIVAGQKLPEETAKQIEGVLGMSCLQMLGMGEGLCTATSLDGDQFERWSTVGAPYSDLDEIRIVVPGTDRDVSPGEVGELLCRGPYTIRGYFDATNHNATAFTDDGFYRSGDLARSHSSGGRTVYSVEGRAKDLINRGGEKINAEEVEGMILRHPDVADVAVVSMPSTRLGEQACAFVVTEPGVVVDFDDLVGHLRQLGVARFKWPERVEYISALPRTLVAKVDKKVLRQRIAETLAAEHATSAALLTKP